MNKLEYSLSIIDELIYGQDKVAEEKDEDGSPFKTSFDTPNFSSERANEDFKIWSSWNKTKRKNDYADLYKRFKGMIASEVNKYTTSPVPNNALKGEANKLFTQALEKYDPSKGVQLNSWVGGYLRKLNRFNITYQNAARITSEDIVGKITPFQNAKEMLTNQLNREPSSAELSDELGWDMKTIERLQRDLGHRDLTLTFTDDEMKDISPDMMDDIFHIYYNRAGPQEKTLLEHAFGLFGKPKITKNTELAKKVGVTSNRVSQMKKRLAKMIVED